MKSQLRPNKLDWNNENKIVWVTKDFSHFGAHAVNTHDDISKLVFLLAINFNRKSSDDDCLSHKLGVAMLQAMSDSMRWPASLSEATERYTRHTFACSHANLLLL